jgi:hypothetical protein
MSEQVMRLRYKQTQVETGGSYFNMSACCPDEVLTGDDTIPVPELEVFIEAKQEWKDMGQAFRDHDLITDNYNTHFFEPKNDTERLCGYRL